MDYIGKICAILEDSSISKVILLGDFNADVNTLFESELMATLDTLNLTISDYLIFGRFSGQFAHVSDAHNTTSWHDHVICSQDIQKKIVSIDILDRLPSSDHPPLYVMLEFNCEHMTAAKLVYSKQAKLTCNWSKADSIELDQYKTLTKELLKKIDLLPAITCNECNCASVEHQLQIDQFYAQLCLALEQASHVSIPSSTVNTSRNYIIPGFTEHVKELHTIARADYCSWRVEGKPRSGPLSCDEAIQIAV